MINSDKKEAALEEKSFLDWTRHMTQKTRKLKKPYSIQFELTPHCTLNCKMCYVHSAHGEYGQEVLNGDNWIEFARQAQLNNIHRITLSGGEAMFHPDFKRIYREIYDMGFEVSIMSNATLITDDMIAFLKERPPYRVVITMYGFCEETYERLCGNGRVFRNVIAAIEKMDALRFSILLQTTVTKENFSDLEKIREYAKNLKIPFQYNSYLTNIGYSDQDVINEHGISQEQREQIVDGGKAKALCDLIGDKLIQVADYYDNKKAVDRGILCGAGNNVFAINWKGEMICCISLPFFKQYPLKDDFSLCITRLFEEAENVPGMVECQTCMYSDRCIICPGAHYADTGEWGKVSERYCWKKQYPELVEKDKAFIAEHRAKYGIVAEKEHEA